MELPSKGTVVVFFALGFVLLLVWMVVLMVKEQARQERRRTRARTAIEANAKAAGRKFTRVGYSDLWRLSGKTSGGVAWEMAYSIDTVESQEEDHDDVIVLAFAPKADHSDTRVRNRISGQKLVWRAPAITHPQRAFRFEARTDEEAPNKIIIDPEDRLWNRWQLRADDEPMARRAFTAAVCEALAMLPEEAAGNTLEDDRTSITLGPNGLTGILGVYEPRAETVETWISACEGIVDGLKQ